MTQSTIPLWRPTTWRWPWRRGADATPGLAAMLDLSVELLGQPDSEAPLLAWLEQLGRSLDARRVTLLLPRPDGGLRQLGAAPECAGRPGCPWRGVPPRLPINGALVDCASCRDAGLRRVLCGVAGEQLGAGALLVEFSRTPRTELRDALRELGGRLGNLLQALAQDRRQRRRELTAERGVLSRELHDTVSQQLSYLQIRVSRLQAVLAEAPVPAEAGPMLDDLRATLGLLHRQVRELIATARLTMDGRTLREAVEASVNEFARRSSCVFDLDNRLPANGMSPEAELQILQVVREALSNVVRHSHARHVRVLLGELPPRGIEVLVEDDGVGLPEQLAEDRHFGLRIMRERVAGLGAQLHIGPAQPQGTRIHLTWRRA